MDQKPINWASLAEVWHCFEGMGLSPDTVKEVSESLESPILLAGGGAGLVPEYLTKQGYDVTSLDACPEMIKKARERNVDSMLCDFSQTKLPKESYRTIILSTGTINSNNTNDGSLESLLAEAERLTSTGGNIIIAYFIANPEMEFVYETLGLNHAPSNNQYFVDSKSIREVKEKIEAYGDLDKRAVDYVFKHFESELTEHLDFINNLGYEAKKIGYEPRIFVRDNFGFKTFDLTPEDEKKLSSKFSEYFDDANQIRLTEKETGILIGKKK